MSKTLSMRKEGDDEVPEVESVSDIEMVVCEDIQIEKKAKNTLDPRCEPLVTKYAELEDLLQKEKA